VFAAAGRRCYHCGGQDGKPRPVAINGTRRAREAGANDSAVVGEGRLIHVAAVEGMGNPSEIFQRRNASRRPWACRAAASVSGIKSAKDGFGIGAAIQSQVTAWWRGLAPFLMAMASGESRFMVVMASPAMAWHPRFGERYVSRANGGRVTPLPVGSPGVSLSKGSTRERDRKSGH